MANLDVRFMKVTVRSVKSTHLVNDGNVMSSHVQTRYPETPVLPHNQRPFTIS